MANNKDLYMTNQEIRNINTRSDINLLDYIPKGSLFLEYKAIHPPTTKNKKSLKQDKII